jgi:hypothetical protein
MAYVQLRITTSPSPALGASPLVPVILDSGDRARVVRAAFARDPEIGDRFAFEGALWEIVHTGDFARGLVARAVKTGSCVH